MTTVKKGVNVLLFKDGVQIGTIGEAKVSFERDVEPYFAINSRSSPSIKEGKLKIVGTIKKAWIDTNILSLICAPGPLTHFVLKFEIEGLYYFYLYNCLFTKGGVTVPQDGFLTEPLEFIGLTQELPGTYLYVNLKEALETSIGFMESPFPEYMSLSDELLFPNLWQFDYSFVDWDDEGGYILLG